MPKTSLCTNERKSLSQHGVSGWRWALQTKTISKATSAASFWETDWISERNQIYVAVTTHKLQRLTVTRWHSRLGQEQPEEIFDVLTSSSSSDDSISEVRKHLDFFFVRREVWRSWRNFSSEALLWFNKAAKGPSASSSWVWCMATVRLQDLLNSGSYRIFSLKGKLRSCFNCRT